MRLVTLAGRLLALPMPVMDNTGIVQPEKGLGGAAPEQGTGGMQGTTFKAPIGPGGQGMADAD